MTQRRYFDWNAGAPLLPEARAAIASLLELRTGNPSSVHMEGRAARDVVESARAEVAALVGAPAAAVVFTAGGSEANATAIHGVLRSGDGAAGKVLLLPRVEHPSLLAAADQAEREGAVVRWLRVGSDGVIDLAHLDEMLAAGSAALVCLQLANSETGVVQPVAAAAARAHAAGALIHCDAVQAAGKLAIAAGEIGADLLALSAHKLGGLAGTGALVVAGETPIEPLIPGTQESHRRGGSENVAGIASFGAAARAAREHPGAWRDVAARRDALEREVCARVAGAVVYGREARRLANTSCLGMPAPLRGPVMTAALDLRGFAVSSGTACSSGVERGSVVVEAMGFGSDDARRTLRVSLGPETASGDVSAFVEALVAVVAAAEGGRP